MGSLDEKFLLDSAKANEAKGKVVTLESELQNEIRPH